MYLLDSDVLIDAKNYYYGFSRVPQFWDWLLYYGTQGKIKIPIEIFDELKKGNDELARWAKNGATKSSLEFTEEVELIHVQTVIQSGYASDLSDMEIEELGSDPFLIAHALSDLQNRCVVTTEVSKPSKNRARRRVPDVCATLGVNCCHAYGFYDVLDFSTNWQEMVES
jgi:hypothetical protein